MNSDGVVPVCSFCMRELVYTDKGPSEWPCAVCDKRYMPTFRWQCPYVYCDWDVCVSCLSEHLRRESGYDRHCSCHDRQ
jgi:hypothetical protein